MSTPLINAALKFLNMRGLLSFLLIIPFSLSAQTNALKVPVNNIILHDPPVIVNSYAEVISIEVCKNEVSVLDGVAFNTNDTVLIIQMKGADIDTGNTVNFGQINNYNNAGNYEMNFVASKTGNVIKLRNAIQRKYDVPNGLVQLIRVPYFKVANYNGEYTCKEWDGKVGGVLVLNAQKVDLIDDIDVSGLGFRFGKYQAGLLSAPCYENNYNYPLSHLGAAFKGEGIAELTSSLLKGKGSPANGGGGGLSNNSGGGGGGNAGSGGYGGYQSDTCGIPVFDNRGVGGYNLNYTTALNKIFMGGGAGAGHSQHEALGAIFRDSRGGGIVIILADTLQTNGNKVLANGGDGIECYIAECDDGMYGGGGGGTVVLAINTYLDNTTIETKGGKGANVISNVTTAGRLGPGGGGGGGLLFLNTPALPGNIAHISNGGNSGVITTDAGNPWGATSGNSGTTLYNLPNLFTNIVFKPNIDSVRINPALITCNSFSFQGLAYTNTNPIQFWQWDFGDNTTSPNQNTTHMYSTENTFTVKLVVTDVNGCKDSINTPVIPKIVTVDAGSNKLFCTNKTISATLFGTGSGLGTYVWSPSNKLDDSTAQNPTATINTTTKFFVTYISNGCMAKDSVEIFISPVPVLYISKSNDINCALPYAKLSATGAAKYVWSPFETLNNSINSTVIANPIVTTKYYLSGTNDNICFGKDSIVVTTDFSKNNMQLPNSFTPNNDGVNDCFGLKYYRGIQNLSFIIYNRYGEMVFSSHNPDECWDGKYKGQPADPGSYVYYLSALTTCGNTVRKGSFLLLK